MKSKYLYCALPLAALLLTKPAKAQSIDDKLKAAGAHRSITTSVPFLTISPDARAGALGDAGAATSPDVNSIYWNSGKLAFMDKDMGFGVTYNPWLRKLVHDMSLAYVAGYKKLSKQEVIGIHLMYFNLGTIQFTNERGDPLEKHSPREFSAGLNYSRKLSERLGVGIGLKGIYSNLSGNVSVVSNGTSTQTKPGVTGAGDVGLYFKDDYMVGAKKLNLALGANISNLGAKISYTNNENKNFIPTNLRLGTAITTEIDPFNKVTFIFDVNKLLVPSPPIYLKNSQGLDSTDASGKKILDPSTNSKDPNRSFIGGAVGSFSDAPGGFKEELQEIIYNFGLEYWYHDGRGNPLFAIRGGHFNEHKMKGGRKYFTLGFGFKYQGFGIDFAYLIPTVKNNPLAESLRFALHFNFNTKRVEESVTE
jgi:hypothetical protein